MILRGLQSGNVQLPWRQLLDQLPLGSLSLLTSSPSSAWAGPLGTCSISTSAGVSAEAEADAEAQQAARELGLDAVPLAKLREMVADALPQDTDDMLAVPQAAAKQKKLTYADLQGYQELLQSLVTLPDTYDKAMPRAPALDAGQWVDTHFKQAGFGFEPRSPFYVWRSWAAAALPASQVQTLFAMDQVMGDDTARAAVLKQAQHELARLWDWQHRRAALGLSLDLNPASPGSSSSSSSSSRSSSSAQAAADGLHAAAAAGGAASSSAAAGSEAQAAAVDALPAAAAATDQAAASGSSSSDDDVSSAANLPADLSGKGMLEVLDASGALAEPPSSSDADKFDEALQGTTAAAAAAAAPVVDLRWMMAIEDVGSTPGEKEAAAAKALEEKLMRRLNPEKTKFTLELLNHKLMNGQSTVERGKYREYDGVAVRQYQPVAHDDDLFLPTRPLGSPKVASTLSDPTKTCAVDPEKVTRQAVAIVEAAKRAAVAAAAVNFDAAMQAAGGGSQAGGLSGQLAGGVDGAEWTSMPLLDRAVLHRQQLREAEERLAAKPKMQLPWQLLPLDSYSFDLQLRPPTTAFDLLTAYLEVRYADVLLRKDAVKTLQRQMAVAALTSGDTGATATEVLESPPAALTAAKTLSPAEREGITAVLDGLLESKQYGQYREAVLQLYCDGLVTWGELQQCWAAAEAGEEMTAAAEAPVAFADDRQQLFTLLSGQQQLGSLTSSSSSSTGSLEAAAAAAAPQSTAADAAAAKKLWDEAGQKLAGSWTAVAKQAHDSSSSSSSKGVVWSEQIPFEEAQRTWHQLLQLSGLTANGPRLEQVLLAGSSSSSSGSSSIEQDELQRQLQQLQQALQAATGLTTSSEGDAGTQGGIAAAAAADDFEQLQQLFTSPPSLEELLKQHWEQVAREELGREVSWNGPTWQQLWQLLEQLTQQQQGAAAAAADGSSSSSSTADATALFDQYLREAEVAPLTPPPYPGARRVLRWEQRMVLGPTSGQTAMPCEVKVKLCVSAAELCKETGLSNKGLQHMLAVAGSRYNLTTGMLSLSCDRFPTREENRRWCLEVLHRLLQEGQAKHPASNFLLGAAGPAAAAAAALS